MRSNLICIRIPHEINRLVRDVLLVVVLDMQSSYYVTKCGAKQPTVGVGFIWYALFLLFWLKTAHAILYPLL
jgi:hypothetical protein